jgi:hypothetical protein
MSSANCGPTRSLDSVRRGDTWQPLGGVAHGVPFVPVMSEPRNEPTCPKCRATMVRRIRGSDGAPFWGCSTFPTCRGTRELVAGASPNRTAAGGEPMSRDRGRGIHFDRLVLVCGAVGLVVGLGFVVAGMNTKPNTFVFLGAIVLATEAIIVLPSPFLPPAFVRSYALKFAVLSVCLAVLFIALDPVSRWLGQYFTDLFTQSIPTHSPATPSVPIGAIHA